MLSMMLRAQRESLKLLPKLSPKPDVVIPQRALREFRYLLSEVPMDGMIYRDLRELQVLWMLELTLRAFREFQVLLTVAHWRSLSRAHARLLAPWTLVPPSEESLELQLLLEKQPRHDLHFLKLSPEVLSESMEVSE